jgi:beta-1,4-mannosyltransferase
MGIMKKKNVTFIPNWSKGNPYQNLLKQACEQHNYNISYDELPSQLFPLLAVAKNNPTTNVIHIHWISTLVSTVTWSKSSLLFWIKCITLIIDCLFVRMKGVKLVWTIHNKVSHENYNKPRELIVRRLLAHCVNKIILHSQEALNAVSALYAISLSKKTEVIFHGNYENFYPQPSQSNTQLRANSNISADDTVLLFFGHLKPYKNIESLIASVNNISNKNVKLIIAGNPQHEEYKETLISLCKNNHNIITDFQYISDSSLSDYIAIADAVILPFSDTLTSGSAILAMTMAKALILPATAKIFGCVPENGVEYFNNENDLAALLENLHQPTLKEMGQVNFLQAQNMTWNKVGLLTTNAYNAL